MTKKKPPELYLCARRPSKYEDTFPEELVEFFGKPRFYERTVTEEKWNEKEGRLDKVKVKKTLQNDFPTFERFAAMKGVVVQTLKNWAHGYVAEGVEYAAKPGFLAAMERGKELQKEFLVSMGLQGHYNPRFAVFVGTNFTDLVERKEINSKNINRNVTPVEALTPEEEKDLNDSLDELEIE